MKISLLNWEIKNKTLNEVSVLTFLKNHTSIPVPKIYEYMSDPEVSLLGREYILMEKIQGLPMHVAYSVTDVNTEAYNKVLTQLADVLFQLRKFEFNSIGNFGEEFHNVSTLTPSGIIDLPNYFVKSSCANFTEYMHLQMSYYISELERLCDEGSEDFEVYQKYLPKLKQVLLSSKFNDNRISEDFVLTHQDLVMKNILVHEDKVTAILDWEWCGSVPQEIESLSGMDFLRTQEDCLFFLEQLQQKNMNEFFTPVPFHREKMYSMVSWTYSLVAYRE